MAIITVSTNVNNNLSNTPALTLASGDTLNLLAGVGIFNFAPGTSNGVQAAGSNSFGLDGDIFSFNAIGLNIAAGGNDINIGAGSTIFGDLQGIAIAGNGNALGIAGQVVSATNTAIQITGQSNIVNVLAGGSVVGAIVGSISRATAAI